MKTFKELVKAKDQYDAILSHLEKELKSKVAFDFSISHQQSDGFCILYEDLDSDDAPKLAPLDQCIEIIEDCGILSLSDYDDICI
jgi:hypothetical protein